MVGQVEYFADKWQQSKDVLLMRLIYALASALVFSMLFLGWSLNYRDELKRRKKKKLVVFAIAAFAIAITAFAIFLP